MSSVAQHKNYISWCFVVIYFIILFIVCIITIPMYVYPYFNAINFEEQQCYIDNISYPTSIPTFDNYNNWAECDCGRRCITYSPCIKLFSNISSNFIKDSYPYDDSEDICTFHQDYCSTGEDIRNIHSYLDESREVYNTYINTTQTCYMNPKTNEIYLNIESSFDSMLASLIIIGIMVTCFIGVFIYIQILSCMEERKRKKESKNVENV